MLPLTLKLRALSDADALAVSEDYHSLAGCQGFAVHDQDGRVGTVRDVQLGQALGGPDVLVVRTGLFIRKLVIIPAAEIDEISTDHRRILVRAQPGRGMARSYRVTRRTGHGLVVCGDRRRRRSGLPRVCGRIARRPDRHCRRDPIRRRLTDADSPCDPRGSRWFATAHCPDLATNRDPAHTPSSHPASIAGYRGQRTSRSCGAAEDTAALRQRARSRTLTKLLPELARRGRHR